LRNGQGPGKGEQVSLKEKNTCVSFSFLKRKKETTTKSPWLQGNSYFREENQAAQAQESFFFNISLFIITLGMTLQEYAEVRKRSTFIYYL